MGRGGLVPPAYRPGLVPRVALTPRMGSRGRGQLMNDLMGECPSLLDDLVFYPMWQGSQCIDMISGTILTISASPATQRDTCPNGEPSTYVDGYQYLSMPSNANIAFGASDFTIMGWMKIVTLSKYLLFGKDGISAGTREYSLAYDRDTQAISMNVCSGIGTERTSVLSGQIKANAWYVVAGGYHRSSNKCFCGVNNEYRSYASAAYTPGTTTQAFILGALSAGEAASGYFSGVGAWRRHVSEQEQAMYYNGGIGLRYPFRR